MKGNNTMKQAIIDAINAGLAAGGDETNWNAPEFADAVRLTGDAGCAWDFMGWLDALNAAESGRLGGVDLA